MREGIKRRQRIKLGFAPTRRALSTEKAFNKDEARRYKGLIEGKLRELNVEYVGLDFLSEEGLIFDAADSEKVARRFAEEGVDALFVPHCNFGCEEAVAKVAKKLGKPVLLWGPRDDEPLSDGMRYRDTQCGLFASSKALARFGVPFTYITNCRLDDELFTRGFDTFVRAAAVVKAFTNLRIGQISTRPAPFLSVKCNEAELLERFGIEIVPMTMVDLKKRYDTALADQKPEIAAVVEGYRTMFTRIEFEKEYLVNVAALRLAIGTWCEEEKLAAAATQCWGPMAETMGISPCFALSELTDDGLPTICEADIHGAITAVMAQASMLGETPIFLADVTVRHPQNDNAELFWHCGVFPKSLARRGTETVLAKHFNRKVPAVASWEIEGGDVTIARFDGLRGAYSLLVSQGKGTSGPRTFGTYAWIEFKDWPELERRLIEGPYIHHVVGIHGKTAAALYEACKYIPGLLPDPVDPTRRELEMSFQY